MTAMDAMVPLVDLEPMNTLVRAEIVGRWEQLIDQGEFILGPALEAFETDFADYCGTSHGIGVASGTDAIEIALRALDIGPGDEVVVPALTFAATGIAVLRSGATPVFADIDPATLLIDPTCVESKIGHRTAAVLAVNLYGQIAPLERLGALAARHGLALLEDGAQSQGARRLGRRVGVASSFYCTSFYPTKNLGAWGDGGALVTGDRALADAARAIRNYGSAIKYDHGRFGFNSRLDPLQSCVLAAKLPYLDRWNAIRARAADWYNSRLADVPQLTRPAVDEGNEHVWHLYTVRHPDRDRLAEELRRHGIGSGVHYPSPLHLLPVFASPDTPPGSLPVAEEAAATLLSLPLFVGITESQQERVVSSIDGLIPVGPE